MIITLKGANFSASNINEYLDSYSISWKNVGKGTTYEKVTSVKKEAAFNTTITIAEGYELNGDVVVTMGGTDITDTVVTVEDSVITISIAKVTGNVVIKVPTVNTAGGGEEEPDTPIILTPHSTVSGCFISSTGTFDARDDSEIVIYAVQPNTTYSISVERNSGATSSNANLIYDPVKSISGVIPGGTPDFATGFTERVVVRSENEQNVLNHMLTTPADCTYLLLSNYQRGSTHTVEVVGNTQPEGSIELTKAVDGVYLGQQAVYTADATSQVLCYAVSPNKTYKIGRTANIEKKLVVCCVTGIDNISAGNTAAFATGWSDRQIGDAGTDLTITTPADCTHLVFSNYLKGQAPTYVKLVD
jgi:hypothetical protein